MPSATRFASKGQCRVSLRRCGKRLKFCLNARWLLAAFVFVGTVHLLRSSGWARASERTGGLGSSSLNMKSSIAPSRSHSEVLSEPLVCIIGVARSFDSAMEAARVWPGFHSFWAVGGLDGAAINASYRRANIRLPSDDIADVLDGRVPAFHVISPEWADGVPNWAGAINATLRHARSTGYPCEYYFLTHDDVSWFLNPSFRESSASSSTVRNIGGRARGGLSAELHSVLRSYRPAVASFSWAHADTEFSGAAQCAGKWSHLRVTPLTTLKATVGVYHASVAEFLLPFPPLDEASPSSSPSQLPHALATLWVNMFVPLMFRSHALRINTIRFNGHSAGPTGTIPVPDETLGDSDQLRYQKFLENGLRTLSWGPYMTPDDVTWSVEVGSPPYSIDIISSLSRVYDTSHSAISGTIKKWQSHFHPSFKIVVFTYNRVASLERLLSSLSEAVYSPMYTIALQVYVDYSPSTRRETEVVLNDFAWSYGPKEVVFATEHKGLRSTILSAWIPQLTSEFAIFLEDDVEVSPYFFEYARSCVEEFGGNQLEGAQPSRHLLGCSLYRPIFSQTTNEYELIDTGNTPFLMQDVSSWGAVFFPTKWRDFLSWYAANSEKDPLIPNSITNLWPVTASWKKFLIRMSVEQGLAMVFPNLPDNKTLSTNHLEPGTNDKGTGASAAAAKVKFTLPLLSYNSTLDGVGTARFTMSILRSPKWDSIQVFDIHRKHLEGPGELIHDLTYFDKATAVVYATSEEFLQETVDAYSSMTNLFAEVVVLWNSVDYPTVNDRLAAPATGTTVAVRTLSAGELGFGSSGDPNHRFLPLPHRSTWAIFNVEAGVVLSPGSVAKGFRAWQQDMEALVGYRFEARTLPLKGSRQMLGTPTESVKAFIPSSCPSFQPVTAPNVVLPAAVFYHGRYAHVYTHSDDIRAWDSIRAAITSRHSGANLMFPVLTSIVGKRSPMVVEDDVNDVMHGRVDSLVVDPEAFELIDMLEEGLVEGTLDRLLPPVVGVNWVNGEPRPVGCR